MSIVLNFSDGKKYLFTEEQAKQIPYLESVLNSDFRESDQEIIEIKHSSIGFKYIHAYLTLEVMPDIPKNIIPFVEKHIDYFSYDEMREDVIEQKNSKNKIINIIFADGVKFELDYSRYLTKIGLFQTLNLDEIDGNVVNVPHRSIGFDYILDELVKGANTVGECSAFRLSNYKYFRTHSAFFDIPLIAIEYYKCRILNSGDRVLEISFTEFGFDICLNDSRDIKMFYSYEETETDSLRNFKEIIFTHLDKGFVDYEINYGYVNKRIGLSLLKCTINQILSDFWSQRLVERDN